MKKMLLIILIMGIAIPHHSSGVWWNKNKAEAPSEKPDTYKVEDAKLKKGMSEAELISQLGEPKGIVGGGARKVLMYDGVQILIVDGRVSEIPDDVESLMKKGKKDREFIAKQKKKGLVLHNGKWIKPAEKERQIKASRARSDGNQNKATAYVMMDKQNRPINHQRYVQRGQITVVDFYADWCGPCRTLAPGLDKLARSQSGIALRKVNIGNWGSSVAEKYNITSVPNVRVFDRKGNMVGPPTSSLSKIEYYIKIAKNN